MRAAALAFLLLAAAAPADKAEQDALKADSRAAALRRDADAADDRARAARQTAIALARRIQNGEVTTVGQMTTADVDAIKAKIGN